MSIPCDFRVGMVMTDLEYQKLLVAVEQLSQAQLAGLEATIRSRVASAFSTPTLEIPAVSAALETKHIAAVCPAIATIEAQFLASPECPHCHSSSIKKWGSANRLQRYRCKGCKVTFNALTGTPLAQLHKRELWAGHTQAIIDGLCLRKVADRLDIGLETAFRWRHRFLQAPKDVKAGTLEGTVEVDETFFLYSEKGSHNLDRPARKRGGKASKRGLSAEQVPVLVARDRNKATADQILPDRSEKSVSEVLLPRIAKDAILVSDGDPAFKAFAAKIQILQVALVASRGEYVYGAYHVQNVNAYTSRLKGWMTKFNGVATKYLDTYLGWQRMRDRDGYTLTANGLLAAAMG